MVQNHPPRFLSFSGARASSDVVPLFGDARMTAIAARMKEIAATSADSLLLANGPPTPDWMLLDLCGDALHYANAEQQSCAIARAMPHAGRPMTDAEYNAFHDKCREGYAHRSKVVQILRRAKKIKATTGAGIYAKALLVRCSKTGAAGMAMSLAEDLVDCKGLRETLWPDWVRHEPASP